MSPKKWAKWTVTERPSRIVGEVVCTRCGRGALLKGTSYPSNLVKAGKDYVHYDARICSFYKKLSNASLQ